MPVEKLYEVVSVVANAVLGTVELALRLPRIVAVVVACGATALDDKVMFPTVLVMLPLVSGLIALEQRPAGIGDLSEIIDLELSGSRVQIDSRSYFSRDKSRCHR